MVRPEHADADQDGDGHGCRGRSTISSISAPTRTSTCASDSGGPFIVRQQNTAAPTQRVSEPGDQVGVARRRRRAGPEAIANATPRPPRPRTRDAAARWLLLGAGTAASSLRGVGPLLIVLVYSFLTPGAYGDVKWKFSPEAWLTVFLERDIFDDTLSIADAARHHLLALACCSRSGDRGDPGRSASRPPISSRRAEAQRSFWLFLITIPFWTQPPDPHLRGAADHPQRGHHQHVLLKLGIIDQPIQILYTDVADHARHGLCLPAADGAADLCQHGKARLPPGRGRLRPLRHAQAPLRRIVFPLVKPGVIAGSILVFIPALGAYVTPRVLGGGKNMMIRQPDRTAVRPGPQLAARRVARRSLMIIVMVALLVYVRKPGGGGAAMAERFSVQPQPGFTPSRRSASSCLYLPIVVLASTPSTPAPRLAHVGGLLAALVQSRPGTNTRSSGGRVPLAGDRDRRRRRRDDRATMAALATTRTAPYPRPHLQIRGDQPAADGAGDRHRRGAPDLLLPGQDCHRLFRPGLL